MRLHLIAVLALGALALPAMADDLIFADVLNAADPDGNSIRRVRTDGVGLHTVVPTGGGVRGLDVDAAGGYIYWTDVDNFVIRRAHLDGTGQQDVVNSGLAFPSALRLDLAAGALFWGDQTNEVVGSAPLAGGGLPLFSTSFFRGLAIDHAGNRLYWTVSLTAATGRINRSNLDGSDPQVAVPTVGSSFKPGNLALDAAAGKIYWTDAVTRTIRRSNLDGSNMEPLFTGTFVGPPKGIVLDLPNGKLYWGQDVNDFDSDGFIYGEIRRMDLDGNNQETVISSLGSVNDIALVPDQSCPADFNQSGDVSVQDIFDFLAAYFGNSPTADFNHSGGISVQDIFDFLAAYFAGCP